MPIWASRAKKGVIQLLSIHKTINGKMTRLDSVQDGCWVNLTYPSEDELNTVAVTLGVEPSFLRAALDEEETSRIDTETEQLIQSAIHTVLRGRTSFVVAHRLSTVRTADKILVIDAGRIAEAGTHDELMAQKGRYYSLYTHQYRSEAQRTFRA